MRDVSCPRTPRVWVEGSWRKNTYYAYLGSTEGARRFPFPKGASMNHVTVHRRDICSVGGIVALQTGLDGRARSGCPFATGRLRKYARSIFFMPCTGSGTATNTSPRSINEPYA